jgi:tetratricopeptide (TPR) repeat protein
MKASIPRALLAAALLGVSFADASAQDAVVLKDGQKREGEITGVRAGAVRVKIGPAETSFPLSNVQSVTMAEPAAYTAAVEAWQKGDAASALAQLEKLVAAYEGLPVAWAERACSLLPEVYLAEGRTADAEKAFAKFQQLYPASGASSDLLLARLAISKNDFDTARAKLEPIVSRARQTLLPAGTDAAAMSQALFLMGQVHENAGEKPEALESYLLVTTLFKNDPASAARADERARALADEKILVP